MRFKLDENLPIAAAELLRQLGHDAMTIHDQQLVGELDPRIAAVCLAEQRALVTLDLDFSDIRTNPPGEFGGIVVLRPRTPGRESVLKLVARLMSLLVSERLDNNLWILAECAKTRLRRAHKNLASDTIFRDWFCR